MQPPNLNTATDAINTLYSTLRALTGPTGLSIVPPPPSVPSNPTTAAQRACTVHSLSLVSLPEARRTLFRALETLKATSIARESWPSEVVDRLLRIKADTNTRARSTQATSTALSICRRLALTDDPFASRCVQAAHRLQAIADDVGAITYRDDADVATSARPSCEISVSGKRFIADFSFPDLTASHVAVDVHFRFLVPESNVEHPEAAVGRSFATLMQQERFSDLRAALHSLVSLERLDETTPSVGLCDALRAIENDLLAAAELEQKFYPNAPSHTLAHGSVERTARGLRILFIPRNSAHLVVEPTRSLREISITRAGVVPTTAHDPAILQQYQQQHHLQPHLQSVMPSVVSFGDAQKARVQAQYVLVLHRPILVALRIAQQLDRIANQEDPSPRPHRSSSLSTRSMVSRDSRDARSDPAERKGPWPSLQRLLAGRVFGGSTSGNQNNRSNTNTTNNGNNSASGTAATAVAALGASSATTGTDARGGGSGVVTGARGVSGGSGGSTGDPDTAGGNFLDSSAQDGGMEDVKRKRGGEQTHDRGLVRERTHWSQPATEYIAAVELPPSGTYIEFSHSGADMVAGVSVCRVPVRHARDVQVVLGLLRQQEMFNELFISCFGSPIKTDELSKLGNSNTINPGGTGGNGGGMMPLLKQPVEVVVTDSPALIQLTLFDAAADDILSIAVHVGPGGDMNVNLQLSNGRQHVCSDAKATALLKLSRSIPLTVRSVIELSRASATAAATAAAAAAAAAAAVTGVPGSGGVGGPTPMLT